MLNAKGQTLAEAKSDSQGHVTLQTDKEAALLLARQEFDRQKLLFDAEIAARNHAMTGSALRVLAAAMRPTSCAPAPCPTCCLRPPIPPGPTRSTP